MSDQEFTPSIAPTQGDEQGSKSKYDRLIARAKTVPSAVTLVVFPGDENSLRGAMEAAEIGIIEPALVGPAGKIREIASRHDIRMDGARIVDAPTECSAAEQAVEMIREAKGELLMKGSL